MKHILEILHQKIHKLIDLIDVPMLLLGSYTIGQWKDFAGLIGIIITLLALIPANIVIHNIADTTAVNASLPPVAGIVLIILSVILTLLGGIVPSKKAAKEDPVTALRTD